jgi:hypothetical protein
LRADLSRQVAFVAPSIGGAIADPMNSYARRRSLAVDAVRPPGYSRNF